MNIPTNLEHMNASIDVGNKHHDCSLKPSVTLSGETISLELRGNTITGDDVYQYLGVDVETQCRLSKKQFLELYEAMHQVNHQLHELD